jgi:hypothetical protein
MKSVCINRYSSTRNGVQSYVTCEEDRWHGLERPWLDNRPFESCIPTGQYILLPWESPTFGPVYIFVGGSVSIEQGKGDRYACLIHSANYTKQLQGCLALGMDKVDWYEPQDSAAVWSSRKALSDFKEKVGYSDPVQVTISWEYGRTF